MQYDYQAIDPCTQTLVYKQRTWIRPDYSCKTVLTKQEIFNKKPGRMTKSELYSKSSKLSKKRLLSVLRIGCKIHNKLHS